MRLSPSRLRALCRVRGWTLTRLLREAGVSRTAYYSLARKPTVLPRSIVALAATLDTGEGDLLEPRSAAETKAYSRLNEARAILSRQPDATFENVWHTLILLDLPPIERLRGSLIRGRAVDLQR